LPVVALARLNFKFEKLFSHPKERIKMHRGLDQNRKKKAVKFLLKNLGKNKNLAPFLFKNTQFLD
jgi:hypothetical protein